MSSIAVKGADTGTGVFTIESPATNTDRTLTLPDEAGEIVTSAKYEQGGAFRAYLGSSQTLVNGVIAKLNINTKDFDELNEFDSTTNYRYQPTIAGYYLIGGSFGVTNMDAEGAIVSYIAKNSSLHSQLGQQYSNNTSTADPATNGSALLYLNGTTDYVDMWGLVQDSTTPTIDIDPDETYFWGYLVRKA